MRRVWYHKTTASALYAWLHAWLGALIYYLLKLWYIRAFLNSQTACSKIKRQFRGEGEREREGEKEREREREKERGRKR
jgi:hypothetical protein